MSKRFTVIPYHGNWAVRDNKNSWLCGIFVDTDQTDAYQTAKKEAQRLTGYITKRDTFLVTR